VQEIISKFKDITLLIALVSTIGGGFYGYGVFNQRLDALEQSKAASNFIGIKKDIKTLNKTIEDLNVEININKATLEYLDAKLQELKQEQNNPLLKM
tara:strand:+ start:1961 stop:2251 length:291 start_codon:yes stop_codon:yes gene_type:complete